MATIEKSIEVNVPVRTAYNQWTQFEEFPRFMEGVSEVEQLDDKRIAWHAEIAGKDETWEAEIVSQVPDERIAWRSIGGVQNNGIVTFTPVAADRTQVHLRIEYEPQGIIETLGDVAGVVSSRVEGDLERFKEFIETHHEATGGWRGVIHSGEVSPEGSKEPPPGNADKRAWADEMRVAGEEEARREGGDGRARSGPPTDL